VILPFSLLNAPKQLSKVMVHLARQQHTMIDELDETLRKLLTRELNQQGLGKVEITFV